VLVLAVASRQRVEVQIAKDPLADLLVEHERVLRLMPEASVLIVSADPERVERDLAAGAVGCPDCGGVLARWGHARARAVRAEQSAPIWLRPRRARCGSCARSHVLLPDLVLLRRVDVVAVIGSALLLAAEGLGHRRVARALGRPAETVRDWLRRARERAERIRVHFSAWAHALDPLLAPLEPGTSALADGVEAMASAARAAQLRLGRRPVWSFVSAMTAGALLSNTNSPWPAP